MSVPNLNTQQVNDVGNLCQDPGTKGFDLHAGQSWIYPTNYSLRDYQYNIIEKALHKNTLVSLPTGLGKTFIAAVVMYNFYRWYPHDKIIFMAPTRPLVKQQMDACYNITAIPQEATAELTGTKVQQSRAEIWQHKRVFFITPQVLQNDLPIILELGPKIKCVVFDEAHRAKGHHTYCEVIRNLLPRNKLFRVLALSATPGNSSKDVIDVMQNLLIAHVEFRSEESPDVKPYVFERVLETVVVPLGEKLQQIKDQYIEILEKYTRTLVKYKVIYGNCGNLTKGKIFLIMKDFQARNSGTRMANYAEIMKSLNICVTLYHAYETLIRCGLRGFLNFYEEHINNPLLSGNILLRQIMEDLNDYLGPRAEVRPLPDGSFTEVPASTKFGHPKFYKLRDILLTHFKNSDPSTRVIVFFEYRESASEAYALLSRSYPMVKCRVFVGQGSGVTQKDQINTIKAFREGSCNTLLSTCIGEEGLDVGEVDLIVCFDIANKSPIRMIQRMGRTGRKKEGRVVVLVTEGKEQQTLKECLIYKNNLGNFVSNSAQLEGGKYADNPKMIPSYIQPRCQKMFITVKKPVAMKNNNLKDMLKKIASNGPKFSDDLQIVEIRERIQNKVENLWDKEFPLQPDCEQPKINFRKHLEKQRSFQANGSIRHSKQTDIFVSLLQFADSKRFNLPVTQHIGKLGDFSQSKVLKQGDIRSMFAKPPSITSSQDTCPPNSQHNYEKEKDTTQSFPAELFDEISAFLSIHSSTRKTCKTCDLLFECPKVDFQEPEHVNLASWVQPDLSILDGITAKDFQIFSASQTPKSKDIYEDFLEGDSEIFDNITFTEAQATPDRKTSYETPRNFDKILKSFRIDEDADEAPEDAAQKSFAYETPKTFGKVLSFLRDSLLEEFQDDDPFSKNEQTQNRKNLEVIVEEPQSDKDLVPSYTQQTKKGNNLATKASESDRDILAFFKLSSIGDIFSNEDLNETVIYTVQVPGQESPKNKSPDLFERSPDLFPSPDEKFNAPQAPESPILCSYERVQQVQVKKRLFERSRNEEVVNKPTLSNLMIKKKSFYESPRKKIERKDLQMPDVGGVCDLSSFPSCDRNEKSTNEIRVSGTKENNNRKKRKLTPLDVSDFCDLSSFLGSQIVGKNNLRIEPKETKIKSPKKAVFDVSDICDIASFLRSDNTRGIDKTKKIETETSKSEEIVDLPNSNKTQGSKRDDLDISDLCDLSIFGLSDYSQKSQAGKNTSNTKIRAEPETKESDDPKQKRNEASLKENPTKDLAVEDLCDISGFFGEDFDPTSLKEKEEDGAKSDETLSDLDFSYFCDAPQKNVQKENKTIIDLGQSPTIEPVTPTAREKSRTLTNQKNEENVKTVDLSQSPMMESVTPTARKRYPDQNNVKTRRLSATKIDVDSYVIDLTGSPVTPTRTQMGKTQLSVTQMLSLIGKAEEPRRTSQKENTFTPTTQKPKSGRSLSTKKGVLHSKQNFGSPRTSQKTNTNSGSKTKSNTASKTNKKKFNISLAGDSDDEFEDTASFKSPIFVKTKPVAPETKRSAKMGDIPEKPTCSKRSKKRDKCEFIEQEAEVSIDGSVAISEDEDSGEDRFEASFVADETQDLLDTTNMHAKYLESVRSPKQGVFKIPQKFRHNVSYVYSQEVDNADNTYMNDSFCVEDAEAASQRLDVSELEVLERKLKEQRKRKKSEEVVGRKKRRRIFVLDDDSD